MRAQPDTELYYLIKKFQQGDSQAGWLFVENEKIKILILSRIAQFRRKYYWIPQEDLEDVQCSLIPRIIELLSEFVLPEKPNDGRVISYFSLRLMGEADALLKKIANLKLVFDEKTRKSFFVHQDSVLEGIEEIIPDKREFVEDLFDRIESERRDVVLNNIIKNFKKDSNDELWFRCYCMRLQNYNWSDIIKIVGYRQPDYVWIKDNVSRFIIRTKHKLLLLGEDVSYRIFSIYTDDNEVAITLFDSHDKKKNIFWLKEYESYQDLDKIEGKIGDIFRQFEINYVVMNEEIVQSIAHIVIMRYLTKREAFVETIDMLQFVKFLPRIPDRVHDNKINDSQKRSYLLYLIKKSQLDEIRESRKRSSELPRDLGGDSDSIVKNS